MLLFVVVEIIDDDDDEMETAVIKWSGNLLSFMPTSTSNPCSKSYKPLFRQKTG